MTTQVQVPYTQESRSSMAQRTTRKRTRDGSPVLDQPQQQDESSQVGFEGLPTRYRAPVTNYSGVGQYPQYSQQDPVAMNRQTIYQSQTGNELTRVTHPAAAGPVQPYSSSNNGGYPITTNPIQTNLTEDEELERRAVLAKRDADGKKRQIPPFVQKLSSFLDRDQNTDLIRWSDKGDSFVVLDEDKFAQNLIPELFKHRNYASFVRQLNMYGFHKKVGLSDNSMRASESKSKNPSEYSNPYFKRNRPSLLWLIQKPKNVSGKSKGGASRQKQDDYDEEVDETFIRENSPALPFQDSMDDSRGLSSGRQQPLLTMGDMSPHLPNDELANVRRDLAAIQRNQQMIFEVLNRTRAEQKQIVGQAKAWQEKHQQHDTSINAILTFLATVYQKNINSDQADANDLFTGSIPSSSQGKGNIVDMGDIRTPTDANHVVKRPLLLEDGKTAAATSKAGIASMAAGRGSGSENQFSWSDRDGNLRSPAVQEVFDATPSNRSSASPQLRPKSANDNRSSMPEADIMSMMNAHNTANFPNTTMDFTDALAHLQNSGAQTPMTPERRSDLLLQMGNDYQTSDNSNTNNSLAFPARSPPNTLLDPAHYDLTSNQFDQIDQLLRSQQNSINNIGNSLAPLSPSGSIPGLNDSEYLDFDHIFNSDSYFNDGTANNGLDLNFDSSELPDFNFDVNSSDTQAGAQAGGGEVDGLGVDGHDDGGGGRVIEAGSSEGTSPANTVDEGAGVGEDEGSANKRQRVR